MKEDMKQLPLQFNDFGIVLYLCFDSFILSFYFNMVDNDGKYQNSGYYVDDTNADDIFTGQDEGITVTHF